MLAGAGASDEPDTGEGGSAEDLKDAASFAALSPRHIVSTVLGFQESRLASNLPPKRRILIFVANTHDADEVLASCDRALRGIAFLHGIWIGLHADGCHWTEAGGQALQSATAVGHERGQHEKDRSGES